MTFFATVNEHRISKVDVYVPQVGAWYADVVLDDGEAPLTGRVRIQIGDLGLVGTVIPGAGDFVLQRSFRVVAGAGGWARPLSAMHYHSDGGVNAHEIAKDAARDCGETLGGFEIAADELPVDYVRRFGPGSAVLERLAGDRQWWVDAGGVTHVGRRAELMPALGSYQVLTYSPLARLVTVACDDPSSIWVGSVLTDRLATPQTVRDLEIHVDKSGMRLQAYTGGDASDASRLGRALDAILNQREAKRLYGTYRYRVYTDAGDGTLSLQVLRPASGLPDVIPVSQSAGVNGALSRLDDGAIVRVAFDEGDPMCPYVAGYPHGSADKASPIARMSDMVVSGGPGTMVTFSLGPAPLFSAPVMALGAPTGTVPVVMTGIPYLVKFGNAFDPIPDPAMLLPPALVEPPGAESTPLLGYILSGSEKGSIE